MYASVILSVYTILRCFSLFALTLSKYFGRRWINNYANFDVVHSHFESFMYKKIKKNSKNSAVLVKFTNEYCGFVCFVIFIFYSDIDLNEFVLLLLVQISLNPKCFENLVKRVEPCYFSMTQLLEFPTALDFTHTKWKTFRIWNHVNVKKNQ